jgi:hypothetical protein
MAFGLDTIIARIEWLEKHLRRLADRIADAEDKAEQDRMREPRPPDRTGEIVIVRPLGAIGMASFTEAVTGPPYQAARLVPATGDAVIWQDWSESTGEMRAFRYVTRWDPDPEPDGTFSNEDAIVTVDNFNRRESIPATADYIVCVRRGNGRLKALLWDCGP